MKIIETTKILDYEQKNREQVSYVVQSGLSTAW